MEQKIINALKEFGLTDYEARVYYSACIAETAGATELSKLSEVPRARIYDILSTLARKGWINIVYGKPTRYRPADFTSIKKKLEDEEKRLKKSKTEILEEIISYSNKEEEATSEAAQDLMLGKEKVLKTIQNWIAASRSDIMIIYFSDAMLKELFTSLESKSRQGVKISIILRLGQKIENPRKMRRLFNIRRGDEKNPKHGCIMVDKKYYQNVFEKEDDINSVMLHYGKCVLCINAWLNRLWEESEKV